MEDFRLWGRIEMIREGELVVTVTAIPETGDPAGISTLTETHSSVSTARFALLELLGKMGRAIIGDGGRVTHTEVDGP
jgi:hypothetical protein